MLYHPIATRRKAKRSEVQQTEMMQNFASQQLNKKDILREFILQPHPYYVIDKLGKSFVKVRAHLHMCMFVSNLFVILPLKLFL